MLCVTCTGCIITRNFLVHCFCFDYTKRDSSSFLEDICNLDVCNLDLSTYLHIQYVLPIYTAYMILFHKSYVAVHASDDDYVSHVQISCSLSCILHLPLRTYLRRLDVDMVSTVDSFSFSCIDLPTSIELIDLLKVIDQI